MWQAGASWGEQSMASTPGGDPGRQRAAPAWDFASCFKTSQKSLFFSVDSLIWYKYTHIKHKIKHICTKKNTATEACPQGIPCTFTPLCLSSWKGTQDVCIIIADFQQALYRLGETKGRDLPLVARWNHRANEAFRSRSFFSCASHLYMVLETSVAAMLEQHGPDLSFHLQQPRNLGKIYETVILEILNPRQ